MNESIMQEFGFSFRRNSVHSSRTIMLDELEMLFDTIPNPKNINEYINAIELDNCLGKRSAKTRKLTARHLTELYTLDPNVPLFKTMLYFWIRDTEGRPLLALLCAAARDSLLRSTLKVILNTPELSILPREKMETFIDSLEANRFSKATIRSIAQNINSSWTKTGHLKGRVRKIRSKANPTPASVAYALYLGYLQEGRGTELFETDYIKMLDCSRERAIELAEVASARGWIVFKRIGNTMETLFPNLISPKEAKLLSE
jgi:hypothetical protein